MPSTRSRPPTSGEPPELAPLLNLLPPTVARLLLVGCGDGSLGVALAAARPGLEVAGLQPAGPLAERAAGALAAVYPWDLHSSADLPEPVGADYDAIVVLTLFSHPQWGAALDRLLPVLADGGALIVWAPSLGGQEALWEIAAPPAAEAEAEWSVLRAGAAALTAETGLSRRGLVVTGREPVTWPLTGHTERLVAAAEADIDGAELRHRLTRAGHLWRAEYIGLGDLDGDAAYVRVRAAMAAAVAGARRAGVDVGPAPEATADEPASSGAAPRVSIVIPVFNQAQFTEACLYAIAAHTEEEGPGSPEYEVIVVDNGSDDWTMYLLHAMEGDIRVVSNDHNLGFARACNQGAAESRGEYVLFLNNDTVPHDGWLRPMVELADGDDGIGIVGAKLLYPETGKIQHAGLAMVQGVPEHIHRGLEADDPRVDAVRDLDMVTGACLMVRRELFEQVGGFDTQYLNGVEDVDLCLRVRDAGYRVVYCPDSVVDHHEAVSDGRFDNVRDNVRRFLERWGERFDEEGRLVPRAKGEATAPAPGAPGAAAVAGVAEVPVTGAPAAKAGSPPRHFRGNWEGSFFLHSSLAYVNREFALALLGSGRCDLGLVPFEPDQFGPEEDPARFEELADRMGQPREAADFHLRHRWPPDFSRPPSGAYVLMQPWEFGRIPRSWVEPLRQSVDQVWAYTEYVRSCYVDSGIDPGCVSVVPLGIDPERFRPGLTPLELDTDRSFRLLFVGGTLHRKGIDLLLEAYRQAFAPEDDVCLVIKDMGVNSFYKNQTAGARVRELQSDAACADILYLTEDMPGEDMPRLYTAADALVHPYRGEGFGLPVAEAMACGLPAVVTAGGACDDFCPPELAYKIPAGRQAIRFQEDTVGQAWQLAPDLQVLTDHLRRVFEHRDEAVERGRRASEHIRAHFTWAAAAAKALEALENLTAPVTSVPGVPIAAADPAGTRDTEAGDAGAAAAVVPQGAAVVVLDGGETADLSAFASIFGDFDRYDVTPGPEHALGAQLEAIRHNAAGREFIAILRSDVDASEADVASLARQLAGDENIGMVSPRRAGGEVDSARYPESACVLLRTAALLRCGGFDGAFQTIAVLANAARCLRRVGAEVAISDDVVFTEVDRPPTILRFGGDAAEANLGKLEMVAVRAVEDGDALRESGSSEAAVEAYRQALEAKSDFVEAILVLADALVDQQRADEAVEVIERLPELDQQSSWAHNYAGIVCHRAGRADAARGHFTRAIELQPDLTEARVNLGVLEWEEGHGEAAVEQFRLASEREPDNRELVANLSLVYQKMAQLDDAVGVLRDYLATHPQDVELQVHLAQLLSSSGDASGARQAAAVALDLDPDNAAARALVESTGPDGEEAGGEEEAS